MEKCTVCGFMLMEIHGEIKCPYCGYLKNKNEQDLPPAVFSNGEKNDIS
jgi:uncharacterized Zn finger protein (UPF0148 family)